MGWTLNYIYKEGINTMMTFIKIIGWVACLHALTAFGIFIYAEVYDLFSFIVFSFELDVGVTLLMIHSGMVYDRKYHNLDKNYTVENNATAVLRKLRRDKQNGA